MCLLLQDPRIPEGRGGQHPAWHPGQPLCTLGLIRARNIPGVLTEACGHACDAPATPATDPASQRRSASGTLRDHLVQFPHLEDEEAKAGSGGRGLRVLGEPKAVVPRTRSPDSPHHAVPSLPNRERGHNNPARPEVKETTTLGRRRKGSSGVC